MIIMQKQPEHDFVVLNLTDPQMSDDEWASGTEQEKILRATLAELINRTSPDLITIAGDLAWAGHMKAYECLAQELDSYKIPWAPVWGNHDNQRGAEQTDSQADLLLQHKYCIMEKGDPELGCGNYVIRIEENEKPIYGLIMMDSHNKMPYINEKGETADDWAHLTEPQIEWYLSQTKALNGAKSALIMHIPFHAYNDAFLAAWNSEYDPKAVAVSDSHDEKYWNDGYKGSYGSRYEDEGCFPFDCGEFDAILKSKSTNLVLVGHDHVNDYVINYKGVALAYVLKTGAGCYWNEELNGGTVLRINENGTSLEHNFVNAKEIIK